MTFLSPHPRMHLTYQDFKFWLIESFHLIGRRPILWIGIAVLYGIAISQSRQFYYIPDFVIAELTGVCIILAHLVDINSRLTWSEFHGVLSGVWKRLFLLGFIYVTVFVLLTAISADNHIESIIPGIFERSADRFAGVGWYGQLSILFVPASLTFATTVMMIMFVGGWFFIPIWMLGADNIVSSFTRSVSVEENNIKLFILILTVLLVTIMLITHFIPLLVIVGYPWFSALLYVSFRDVFLGRGKNMSEVKARQETNVVSDI